MKDFDHAQKTLIDWVPPNSWKKIQVIDAHTGGEPLRVIVGGLPEIQGRTILEKRKVIQEHHDWIRTSLLWEPRGHADMYGCIITPPVNEGSDFGVLFLHNEGYSTMCGHGIIAIVKVVLTCGMINMREPTTTINIDSPAGLITAFAESKNGMVSSVRFQNVPSFVFSLHNTIHIDGLGTINYDVAYGGAFYAFVSARECGVQLQSSAYRELIEKGISIKKAIMKSQPIQHPVERDLSFLYGVIFIDESDTQEVHSRNVCVFAEGEIDRSPTGTGVSARLALHHAKGELKVGESITIESIVGSTFKCTIKSTTKFEKYPAIIPEVEGTSYITGKHTFLIDPDDPFKKGFFLR